MRVEQVRAFVVLAEELNFRRAAARLFVSQPTLTAQLHQLERDLGVVLFDRGPGGTRLTRRGAELLPAAREVLRSIEDLAEPGRGRPDAATSPPGAGGARPRRHRAGHLAGHPGARPRRARTSSRSSPLCCSPQSCPPSTAVTSTRCSCTARWTSAGPRRVVTVGYVPVGVLLPRNHWLADRAAVDLDDGPAVLARRAPGEMGDAFTRFWFPPAPLPPGPGAPGVGADARDGLRGRADRARGALADRHPGTPGLRCGRAAPAQPLRAPLQVVVRDGWPLTGDLVDAARDGRSGHGAAVPGDQPSPGDHES